MSSEIDSNTNEKNNFVIEKENEYSSKEIRLPDFVQNHKNILPHIIYIVDEHKSQNSVEEVLAEEVSQHYLHFDFIRKNGFFKMI